MGVQHVFCFGGARMCRSQMIVSVVIVWAKRQNWSFFFSPSGMGEDKVCDKSYLRKHFWFSFSVCFSGRCDSPSCHLFILKLEPCPSTGFHWHVVLLFKCSSPDVGITCFSLNYTDYLVQIDLIWIWWLWEDSQRENILRQNWLMSNIWTILTSCCGHITLWVW